MSLLWIGGSKLKLTIKYANRKPSPTYQNKKILRDSARNSESLSGRGKNCSSSIFRFIKGISPVTSFFGEADAGMTVEASIVLPLFVFFFLNLGCAMEMIRLHGNIQLALWQTGSRLAIYGYALDSGERPGDGAESGASGGDEWWRDPAGSAIGSAYVKSRIISLAGEGYLDSSPLTDGAEGLSLWESEIFGPDGEMDIVVTYSVSPLTSVVGFSSFRMANRYYAHIWNGYQITEETEEVTTVYITETGSVYHGTRDCSHLRLSVRQISSSAIEGERNQNGGRYQSCSLCARGNMPAVLYITQEGNRYHYRGECSGLRRTVYSVSLDEALAEGYRACSRCGG